MTTTTCEAVHGTETLSDDRLMAALNAGEVEASLSALKERYEVRVHNLVHRIVRDSHLADDVTRALGDEVYPDGRSIGLVQRALVVKHGGRSAHDDDRAQTREQQPPTPPPSRRSTE